MEQNNKESSLMTFHDHLEKIEPHLVARLPDQDEHSSIIKLACWGVLEIFISIEFSWSNTFCITKVETVE